MSTAFQFPEWLPGAEPSPSPPVDDHRIEALVNRFIAAKQEALFTAPDAFYRRSGADAVAGAPATVQRLNDLKSEILDQALDDGERGALGPRLDLHIDDANDGIDRHVAEQRRVHQRQILSERQTLIRRAAELEHDNDDKIAGLAAANASAASELARMDGRSEAAAMDEARSAVWRTAIDERIASRKGPEALALFDQVKDRLVPADRLSLDTPVQVARYEHAADEWIAGQTGTDGPPLRQRVDSDPNLPPEAKAIVRAKVDAQESASESARVAQVQALDDEARTAMHAQAVNPRAYKPGTFARLADAYDKAGAPESAAFARRLGTYDAFIASFAQASAEKQRQMIDKLPEEWRPIAAIIQDRQVAVFAQDAFAAGTALYKEVGQPVPIDDVQGRIRQARQIAELRGGIPVMPFTVREIRQMQRTLASGSEQDKEAVRTRLSAVPVDMRPAIEAENNVASTDQGAAPPTESAPAFGVQAASEIDADETTEAANTSTTPSAGGHAGAPVIGPTPGSPEYQAAEAQARELDKPSYDDLSTWEKLKIEGKRVVLEGDSRGAAFRADSAARRWQRTQELLNDPEIGVVGRRFLLKNRNVTTELAAAVGQLADAQRKLGELPSSNALRQLFEARSVAEVAKLLDEKGSKIASAAGLGSLPMLTAGIAASAILGPIGGGLVFTGTGGMDGYAKGLIGALAQRGIDVTDPNELVAAFQDEALMDVVRDEATTDGMIEAGVAAVASMAFARGRTPRKLQPAKQLAANAAKGKAFEGAIRKALEKKVLEGWEFAEQVTIKPKHGGPNVRVDFIVRDPEGTIYLIDAKAGDIAKLTRNQKVSFPQLAEGGGTIVGKGKPGDNVRKGFGGGMVIPKTRVQIETPKGAQYVNRATDSNRLSLEGWYDPKGRIDYR